MNLILLCVVVAFVLVMWKADSLYNENLLPRIVLTLIYGSIYSGCLWAVLSGCMWLFALQPFRLSVGLMKDGRLLYAFF